MRRAESRSQLVWATALLVAQFALIVAVGVLPSTWHAPLWVRVPAWCVAGAGACWLAGGAISLGASLAALPLPVPGADLRTGGLYRFSRHPTYTGILGLTGGAVAAGPSWARVAAWFALAVVLSVKARYEETLLARTYPQYAEYARRTRRFFPTLR